MHAYLYSKYSSDPAYGKTKFDDAFNKFQAEIKREKPYLDQDSEHKNMAENWIELLATELQNLHENQGDSYNRFWNVMKDCGIVINDHNKNIYYKSLAWEGLENTNAYIKMEPTLKKK